MELVLNTNTMDHIVIKTRFLENTSSVLTSLIESLNQKALQLQPGTPLLPGVSLLQLAVSFLDYHFSWHNFHDLRTIWHPLSE